MNSMRSDFHIPSAPAASMNQFQNTKGQNPLRLPFATFRLILQLEKTVVNSMAPEKRLMDATTPKTGPEAGAAPGLAG